MISSSKKTILFDLLILFVVSFLFYFLFMGSYMLLSPDEGRYASISLEMLMRGEWITPYQNGIVFMDKPILVYWLEIISMKLFGINEWAVRLVPMCFGVLGILATYIAGSQLFNRRTALIASCILMTAPFYFMLSHYVSMDLAVAVLISCALWFVLLALHCANNKKRRLYCYLAYIFAGLAFLTKGLIGIIFPMIIAGLWIIIFNQWRQLKKIHYLTGIGIILAINLPWYVAMQHANPNFFHYFFIFQQLDRYVGYGFNMVNPFYYYGVVLCVGFLPWVVFFPQSISFIARRLYTYKKASVEWFLVLWVVVIFIFFSIPASKVSSYILPIFPPMAVIVAQYFDHYWDNLFSKRSIRWSLRILLGFIILLIAAAVFLLVKPLQILLPSHVVLVFMIIFLISIIIGGYIVKRYTKKSVYFFTFFLFATMFFLSFLYSQIKAVTPQTTKEIATRMRKALMPGAIPVISANAYDQAFPFYVQRPLYIFSNVWHNPILTTRDNWQGEFVRGAQLYNNYKYLIDVRTLRLLWRFYPKAIVCIKEVDMPLVKRIVRRRPYRIIVKLNGFYLITQKDPRIGGKKINYAKWKKQTNHIERLSLGWKKS